ncbi:MAG: chalcone isomerase family protein, partial [Gemmataceae bacterium]
ISEIKVGDKPTKTVLTGTAMRSKLIVNVYAIGSYVEEGAGIRTAADLLTCDKIKRLHLVMERNVSGSDFAEAFRAAVRMNYNPPMFQEEIDSLVAYMKTTSLRKGDNIYLTHLPGTGLHISVPGKADFLIKNTKFSQAIWEIYLGKNNLGENIKKGLVNRL